MHRFIKKQLEFKKWNESIKSKQKTDIELKVNQPSNRTVTKHWMIPQAITWQLMSCVLIMHEHYYLVSRGNNSRWQKGHIFSQWRSYWALYLSSFVFENVPKGRDLSLKSLAENGKRNYFSSLFKCFLPRLQCPRNFLKIENLLRHPALSIFSSALQSEIT